jgi:NADPH-dependent 2,4-dienoyl-CoA reductase/sulfur reductase-like enzyme
MADYRYLIIGGGMTAAAAIEGIREVDAQGSVGVISAETHRPYNRPPLSKGLWTGKKTEGQIWRPAPEGVEFHLGRRAQSIDLAHQQVVDDQGTTYGFAKLLLATGGDPRRLPFGGEQVIYFRTLESYHQLRRLADGEGRIGVLGGGFIGSEIAAALAMQGKPVSMVFPEPGIGHLVFPSDLSSFLNDYFRQKGVEVIPGELAAGIGGSGPSLTLQTDRGRALEVNGVVAGLGIRPNLQLAEAAGMVVADGIRVDERMQTSHPDAFAAGDVARFPDALLGTARRVEHEDAANSQGRIAGRNMAGADDRYQTSPYFYSDLFDLGYEAVGELDSRLDIVPDWQEPFRKGVVYYLREGRLRGVLLWDVWGQVQAARELIGAGKKFKPRDLRGRIGAA